jgi:hypothetical protein
MAETIADSQFSKRDNKPDCHASQIHETPGNIGLSRCHASNTPEKEKELADAMLL